MAFGKKGKATRFDWKKNNQTAIKSTAQEKKGFYKEEDESKEEEEEHLGITERHQRSEIAAIIIRALDSLPKREWKKAVVFVMTALKMKSGSKMLLKFYFFRVLDFGALGQIYNGERKSGTGKLNTCVSVESMNAQIIADALENNENREKT